MSNNPLGLAVLCRKINNFTVQVLLHKTGTGPYNQRSWAFPGGLMNRANDQQNNWYAGVHRELEQICQKEGTGQLPNLTPLANTMEQSNQGKNYVYYIIAVPTGNENWPHTAPSNEFIQVGGTQCPTKNGFAWVDWNSMIDEALSFKQNRGNTNSNIMKNVLSWFASHGERVLTNQLGGTRGPGGQHGGGGAGGGGGGGGGGVTRDGMDSDRNTICKFIQSGQPCKFGDRCRFSHNLASAGGGAGAFGTAAPSPFGATGGSAFSTAPSATALPGSATPVDPNTPQLKQLVELFVQHYQGMLANPQSDFTSVYAPTAILTFEGESVVGAQQVNAKLKAIQMQGVKMMKLWNASWQQISGINTVLVTVAGMLVVEGRPEMPCVQVFHLIQSGTAWQVSNHLFFLMKAPGTA